MMTTQADLILPPSPRGVGHTSRDDPTQATRMVAQALDMLRVVSRMVMPGVLGEAEPVPLRIRIGIHTARCIIFSSDSHVLTRSLRSSIRGILWFSHAVLLFSLPPAFRAPSTRA